MYILVQDFARPGDYVVNQHTGEIKPAMWVDGIGNAIIDEIFDMDCTGCGPKYISWSINDYFVLTKAANMYFDGNFRIIS